MLSRIVVEREGHWFDASKATLWQPMIGDEVLFSAAITRLGSIALRSRTSNEWQIATIDDVAARLASAVSTQSVLRDEDVDALLESVPMKFSSLMGDLMPFQPSKEI